MLNYFQKQIFLWRFNRHSWSMGKSEEQWIERSLRFKVNLDFIPKPKKQTVQYKKSPGKNLWEKFYLFQPNFSNTSPDKSVLLLSLKQTHLSKEKWKEKVIFLIKHEQWDILPLWLETPADQKIEKRAWLIETLKPSIEVLLSPYFSSTPALKIGSFSGLSQKLSSLFKTYAKINLFLPPPTLDSFLSLKSFESQDLKQSTNGLLKENTSVDSFFSLLLEALKKTCMIYNQKSEKMQNVFKEKNSLNYQKYIYREAKILGIRFSDILDEFICPESLFSNDLYYMIQAFQNSKSFSDPTKISVYESQLRKIVWFYFTQKIYNGISGEMERGMKSYLDDNNRWVSLEFIKNAIDNDVFFNLKVEERERFKLQDVIPIIDKLPILDKNIGTERKKGRL